MKTSTIRKLSLSDLRIAPENVRKTPASASSNQELKASIRAHGMTQNLGAYQGTDGLFYVQAGGRRLTALNELAAEGAIAADIKVNVLVADVCDARELSLVENLMRASMHPADEYDAFAALVAQGRTEDDIATRFGVSVLHVRKRLRLAAVAPELVARYRAGEISLETLMAFTLSDSHDRQLEVWKRIEPNLRYGGNPVYSIKQHLNETRVSASTRLGRFVGVDRYKAAGGAITSDLFATTDQIFFDDPALVERLALERLEEAAALRSEWKWIDVMIDIPHTVFDTHARVYAEAIALPVELQTELDEIEGRFEEFSQIEELSEEQAAEFETLEKRAEEIAEIGDSLGDGFQPEAKAIAGGVLSVGFSGDIRYDLGLVRLDDIPATEEPATPNVPVEDAATEIEAAESADEEDSVDSADVEASATREPTPETSPLRICMPRGIATNRTSDTDVGPAAAALKSVGLSTALGEDLRAIRHQVLQAHLASDFEVAFDLALYSMCLSVFGTGTVARPIDLSITPAAVHNSSQHRTGTVAETMLAALKANLRLEWMALPKAEGFDALCALQAHEKQALFAFTVSHGVRQQLSVDDGALPAIEIAGRRMKVDVADCWRPTAANYFGRVKKDLLIATARDMIDDQWAADHGDAKKGELAASMEAAFSTTARMRLGLAAEAAERTGKWLPAGMGFGVDEPVGPSLATGETPEFDADNASAEASKAQDADLALPAFLIGGDVPAEDQDTGASFYAAAAE